MADYILDKIDLNGKEDVSMKKLNDYLYSGDTVLKILQRYTEDLKKSAKETNNPIDLVHSNFFLKDNALWLGKRYDQNQECSHVSFRMVRLDNGASWQSQVFSVNPSKRGEYFRMAFENLPDGIYLLYRFEHVVFEGGFEENPPPAFDNLENAEAIPRFIELKGREISLLERNPYVKERAFLPGETMNIKPMQDCPSILYSKNCSFDTFGMKLEAKDIVRILLPNGAKTLSFSFMAFRGADAILTAYAKDTPLISLDLKKASTNAACDLKLPVPENDGNLDIRFELKNKYEKRTSNIDKALYLRSIALLE